MSKAKVEQKESGFPPAVSMGLCICLGTGIGVSLGVAFGNIAMGVALGASVGILIGAMIQAYTPKNK